MVIRDWLLAGAAVLTVLSVAGPADAQKLKPFIVDNTVYSAAEFKALTKQEQKDLKAIQKVETGAYKAIFKAAKKGDFSKVGYTQYESLLSDPNIEFFYADNSMDVTAANLVGEDPTVYAGLDRFMGGSNSGVKFSLAKFLPSLQDSAGNTLDLSLVTGVSAGKGGQKIQKGGISFDADSGDVSVLLKPSKKGFARNQYVNLNIHIEGVGPVQVTYWLNESNPDTRLTFEQPTLFGEGGSFTVDLAEFRKNGTTDAFDPTILAGRLLGGLDTTTVVTGVNTTTGKVSGVAPEEFAAIIGFMTNGKLIQTSYGSFPNASPSG